MKKQMLTNKKKLKIEIKIKNSSWVCYLIEFLFIFFVCRRKLFFFANYKCEHKIETIKMGICFNFVDNMMIFKIVFYFEKYYFFVFL